MASIKPVVNYSGEFAVVQSGDVIDTTAGGTGLSSFVTGSYIRALNSSTLELRTPAQLLSDIGALAASSYTAADVLAKLLTVDGVGSGVDADLLDGQHGAYYLTASNLTGTLADARLSSNVPLKNASNDFTSTFSLSAGGSSFSLKAGATVDHVYMSFFADSQAQGVRSGYFGYGSGGTTLLTIANEMAGGINLTSSGLIQANGSTIWTAANDGAGSGMDADFLDGQHGAYYLDLTNVTGTLTANKGGTGIASYTTGNYLRAASSTSLEQRTPANVRTDIAAITSTTSETAPVAPNPGDEWIKPSAAKNYKWFDDGTSAQWVEFDSVTIVGGSGGGSGSGPATYIQDTQPNLDSPLFWIETGLGDDGEDFTVWFNDIT